MLVPMQRPYRGSTMLREVYRREHNDRAAKTLGTRAGKGVGAQRPSAASSKVSFVARVFPEFYGRSPAAQAEATAA